jgi:hypothetical protein
MHEINYLSDGIPDAISSSDTISVTIPDRSEAISEALPNSNPEVIPDYTQRFTLLPQGAFRQSLCEAVGEHLSSR